VDEEPSKLVHDSERESAASYERWKNQSMIPFRFSFGGLIILGIAGWHFVEKVWSTPLWPLGALATAIFVAGVLTILYDIPQRRLSKVSKAFLGIGVLVVIVVMFIGLIE
jgi:hypothetical protein